MTDEEEGTESLITQTLRQMSKIRKFKVHHDLDPGTADNEGFNFTVVTEVEKKPDGSMFFWVMPHELKESHSAYKKVLTETYSDEDIPTISMEDLPEFKRHIVIAKIGQEWARAEILNISEQDNVVGLVDIDSGRKVIGVLPRDLIKVPYVQELDKQPYAFKVLFENFDTKEPIEAGKVLKIRITNKVPYTATWAVIKTADDAETETPASPPEVEVAVIEEPVKLRQYSIDDLQIKQMYTGLKRKLLYIDGSHLDKGFLHLCESVKENWVFYDNLATEISKYVEENPPTKAYKPV